MQPHESSSESIIASSIRAASQNAAAALLSPLALRVSLPPALRMSFDEQHDAPWVQVLLRTKPLFPGLLPCLPHCFALAGQRMVSGLWSGLVLCAFHVCVYSIVFFAENSRRGVRDVAYVYGLLTASGSGSLQVFHTEAASSVSASWAQDFRATPNLFLLLLRSLIRCIRSSFTLPADHALQPG